MKPKKNSKITGLKEKEVLKKRIQIVLEHTFYDYLAKYNLGITLTKIITYQLINIT